MSEADSDNDGSHHASEDTKNPALWLDEGAEVKENGRINVDLDSRLSRVLSRFIPADFDFERPPTPQTPPPKYEDLRQTSVIKLNIVIQVVGSRGDVQPFIAVGNELQKHGHRVRLATHNVFENFVKESGLEFYPIGGDPSELMAYMVKNPGLIPSMKSLRAGDIQTKRKMITEMLDGCWESCIEPDVVTGIPFTADAIIANPPSFAHVHCAQALGCPVHLMFTMPWSSTRAFPHPLADLKSSSEKTDVNSGKSNYLSYMIFEWLAWQGLGDIINKWRRDIDLEPVPVTEGPSLAETLKVPFTYCWSPALVPKPLDWPSYIGKDPPAYNPPEDLDTFLRGGPMPIYIGFGSIVIDDPEKLTNMILEAVRRTGVRAIISRGWSKLGGTRENEIGSDVFFLGDCPHEWLFQHVAAVIHHGGAGTTACGLLNARPTTIVPFFGDQPFWGKMVATAGAGPSPIAHKILNEENLVQAIEYCLTPQASRAAQQIAEKMRTENGVRTAVDSFHRHLPMEKLTCDILPDQPAVWTYKKSKKHMKLSKAAAQILMQQSKLDRKDLKYYEPKPFLIETRRWDPVTASASAALGTGADMINATVGVVSRPYEEYQKAKAVRAKSSSLALSQNASASASATTLQTPLHDDDGSRKASSDHHDTQSLHRSVTQSRGDSGAMVAGKMAFASAKSLGNIVGSQYKGMFVDVPLAVTDGLNALPGLYGSHVRERKQITGFRSGTAVAGKSFVFGIAEGMADIFVEPYKGARKEGVVGAVKGVGKGSLGFLTRTGAAGLGLVAYTGQGVYKSVHNASHAGTKHLIVKRRHEDSIYVMENAHKLQFDKEAIVTKFVHLKKGVGESHDESHV
ncbi:hypothetical protein BP6252_10254 [Coleophoma cylindrospora]|uniref:Uncharacterized protein n=1 Tax=Coleophoma cylindrospora TaxID=1849047 RepID=A0A3D8QS04_9HELO|nr:hypothetical protein BP6252_10254 [Coleophoma cylindrospora]